MEFLIPLSQDELEIREQLRELCLMKLQSVSGEDSFMKKWKLVSEWGVFKLVLPEELGGFNKNANALFVALETLGEFHADNGFNFAICAHLLACVIPIAKFGNQEQKTQILPYLLDGTSICANGMTETESGSDAFHMQTNAIRNQNFYLLNGKKCFASNGTVSDYALIYAITDKSKGFFGGVSAFLLSKKLNEYASGPKYEKMGLQSCDLSDLFFDSIEISAASLLDKEGSGPYIFNYSMNWERALISAIHIGQMRRMLSKTITYTKERVTSGKRLFEHQSISHKLAEMKVKLETSRTLAYSVSLRLNNTKGLQSFCATSKLYVSERVNFISMNCFQIFGGYGYMKGYEIEQDVRDALSATLYSGTSEVMKNLISKDL